METSAATQLPDVDALPHGFLESPTELPQRSTPDSQQGKPCDKVDYRQDDYSIPEYAPVQLDGNEPGEDGLIFQGPTQDASRDRREEGVVAASTSVSCDPSNEEMELTLNKDSETASEDVSVPGPPQAAPPIPSEIRNNKTTGVTEMKQKGVKRAAKSEKEFLEFTLRYQQVLAERDSAITVRDRLESLCRELQRQNKMLMDECKRVSNEGQNLRLDLSTKFQDAIKDVSVKLDEQKEECITQLKENEMLRNKLKQLCDQYTLAEQQFTQKLKHKDLELQLADLKLKQQEEKVVHEQSQMKLHADQISQLLATEKSLRSQLTADGEKFQQFQDALVKSNEVFETFKQEIEKMGKSIKDLRKENTFLKGKCEKTDVTLIQLVEERLFLVGS
uniref:Uncharacterized protein n=1 Tax=Kalanchoe fedtschenkoi TaxID=63787 RepID=A0A7N0TKS1_KALFE